MFAMPAIPELKSHQGELTQGICAEIIATTDSIHGMLVLAGRPVRAYTARGVEKLIALDDAARCEILTNLKNWESILSAAALEMSLDNVNEVALAEKAMKHFRFHLRGHDWSEFGDDEMIEIYNNEGVQLYRSLNFFSICGYSLLDLCVNKWFELWERPTSTLDAMNKLVISVITSAKKDTCAGIAPHLVRETYDDGTTQPFVPRATLAIFNKIFPVYSPGSNDVAGIIITSTGKPISIGAEAMELGFI